MTEKTISLDVKESLTEKFDLISPYQCGQDWEYINVLDTNELIDPLVDALEGEELSEDERYATMLIVVNSIDSLIEPGEPLPEAWKRTTALLHSNFQAFEPVVRQYISLDKKPEDRFRICKHLLAEFPELDPDAEPAANPEG